MKNNTKNILILHGWGLSGNRYILLKTLLEKSGYAVYAPDLPGFGKEQLKNPYMKLQDYVLFVHNFVRKKKITPFIVIGHSFGGRVAIKYAVTYPHDIELLVLTGVPIIRHVSLKQQAGYSIAKLGNLILPSFFSVIKMNTKKVLYFTLGEWDYYNAGPLQEVFRNIISEDLVQYATAIKVQVVCIWGENDRITPVSDLKKIQTMIPHASVVIIPGAGHKLPYEKPQDFLKSLKKYL